MKILLVSEYFPPKIFGGGEISAWHLARGLAGKEVGVSVLTSKFPELPGFELKDGVKIYRRLETGKNPRSLLKRKILFPRSVKRELEKLDRDENFDCIHFLNTSSIVPYKKRTLATINGYGNFCPKGNLFHKDEEVCLGCGFFKFLPCILNSEYAGKVKLRSWLKYNPGFWILAYWNFRLRNRILKEVDGFVAVSDFIRRLLLRNGISEGRIQKIPNIISIRDSGRGYPLDFERPIVTYIGVLEKIKGIDLLIDAFEQLKEPATLLIVGEGSERKRLERMAGKRVKFLGSVGYEYMPAIYKQSDIIVLPSRWPEPIPRVLIEACYFGKPVIATDVGGNRECIKDEENGFLVKDGEDLKEKLGILVKDKGFRERMGGGSKKLFERNFNEENLIKRIVDLYENFGI
jgi:glycosyltransferase involved in cell wall biosynthesis